MCPRATQTCEICEKVVSKYKCPSCLVPYCSLGCFKIHKVCNLINNAETPCAKPSDPSSTEEKPVVQCEPWFESCSGFVAASPAKEVPVKRPEEANDVVEKTQQKASASSSEIREALKDEPLQKLIYSIDSSSNPLQELDEAMGIEAFREFTDKILSNISKSNDEQGISTMDIGKELPAMEEEEIVASDGDQQTDHKDSSEVGSTPG
ncbi:putative protein [Arabidopsis thaliana]|uniref:Uncharacterized protein AT4g28820 n=1 Tax=Arabidopsis thaliana TaxID=3702 RepID=Q9SVU9_ARATH|nr:putative protein [Arabidopsis thaliana]CAB81470.1 putative protein [Arabidopsis thaliana]